MKDKKQALAEVQAKMYKQTYCPGNIFILSRSCYTNQKLIFFL
jgi:hypothetical protein